VTVRATNRDEAPALSRGDGLVSRLLHSAGEAETDLTITWVEVDPGASQVLHSHDPEQVYIVVAGEGVMHVGGETRPVEAGDLVYIPSNTEHGIDNTGEDVLEYISAATPAFPRDQVKEFYDG
jgi:mannose-6-phosphate isomerase-like protein (cupin superfamily)